MREEEERKSVPGRVASLHTPSPQPKVKQTGQKKERQHCLCKHVGVYVYGSAEWFLTVSYM